LSALAARGAQVGVVTNSLAANDVAAVHGGYMGYRVPLLKAGVQLYELKAHGQLDTSLFGSSGASLHTKAFVVDDRRGFVGSFNLDPRSAYLNTEMGVLFDDPVLGAQLRDEYLRLASRNTAGGWPWATMMGCAGCSGNRHRTGWRPNPGRAWASAGLRG
jgi:putative cardiolipin synthase